MNTVPHRRRGVTPEYWRDYYQAHKEKIKARSKAWYENNKQRALETARQYHKANARRTKKLKRIRYLATRATKATTIHGCTLPPWGKRCCTCHNFLPFECFGKHKKRKDGLHFRCRDCAKKKDRQRSETTKKKKRATAAEYKKRHRAKYAAAQRAREATKRGVTIGNPEAIALFYEAARNAARIKCHWCRKDVPKSRRNVDHIIPIARGGTHSLDNLCVSCDTCNFRKHATLPEEFNQSLAEPLLII